VTHKRDPYELSNEWCILDILYWTFWGTWNYENINTCEIFDMW